MKGRRSPLVETLALGVAFLLPLILVTFLLRQAVLFLAAVIDHLEPLLPRAMAGGPVVDTLVAVILLFLLILAAGIIGRLGVSRRLLRGFEHSPLTAVPPFSFARAISAALAHDDPDVRVVLVPTDRGQMLAFVFGEPAGDHVCVFLPDAPNWTSGQVAFFRSADVQPTGLGILEAIQLITRLGASAQNAAPALFPGERGTG